MNKTRLLIWVIAFFVAGTALYDLLPTFWRHWWNVLQLWIQGDNPYKSFPFWVLPVEVFFDLIYIFKLIASYGMFRFRSWGRTLAVYVLSADFIIGLIGFINRQTYHWRHPEPPPIPPGYVQVQVISLWPFYIIAIISLLSVIALTKKSVRVGFEKG
jgi:hypothetical protein